MSVQLSERKRRSPIEVVQQWWQAWTSNGPALANPCCSAESEVERIAIDIGMSAAELRRLISQGPEAADLLLRRMAALDLDHKEVAQVEPKTFRDLQRICTMCESHRQCARHLSRDAGNSAWENYCPNVATLKALNAMPWSWQRER
jgi:glycerol-3-phosphate dehydrogenase